MAPNKKPPAAVASAGGGRSEGVDAPTLRQSGGAEPVGKSRRLFSSGHGNPCPICSRTKDGDCRWSDDWIACHTGAAANNLQPGQTIEATGQLWYLSRIGGGHSGMAHVYRPHRPGVRPGAGVRPAQAALRAEIAVRACRIHQANLLPCVHAALRCPPWEDCTPEQLSRAEDLLTATLDGVQQQVKRLQQCRRTDPALARLLPAARYWLKAIGYQLADLRRFQRDCLGMQEGWR